MERTLPVNEDESLAPAAEADAPSLYVERRAARRAGPGDEPSPATRTLPRWLVPVAGLALTALAAVLLGPVAAAICAVAVVVVQATALARLGREADRFDQLAHTDHLTRLYNSRALWRDLENLINKHAVALMMVDLDHFKSINDGHGHPTGDAVLQAFGALLPDVAGADNRCYRYGGEEFVVLLPGLGEDAGVELAERLRLRVAEGLSAALPMVSLSAGVAAAAPGLAAHRLLDRADSALRRAKVAGRDRVERASRLDHRQVAEDDATVAARRAALAMASAALEARDPDTADHSDEVVMLCEALADRLGITGAEREHLLLAASLHDVGKVAVPHAILAKPGPLDNAEWAVMREHTITGEQILRSVPELEPIAPLVRSAHERFDGNGYPDGLSGEEIPLGSRVILCADAFHAMRSDRPYRAGRSTDAAAEELRANAGSQFDPVIVATLVDVVRDANRSDPPSALRHAMRMSPRLMALLATATIGGSAMAAIPSLRERVRDLVAGAPQKPAAVTPARPAGSPASCAEVALSGASCGSSSAFRPLIVRLARTGGAATSPSAFPRPGGPTAGTPAVSGATVAPGDASLPATSAALPAPSVSTEELGASGAGASDDHSAPSVESPGTSNVSTGASGPTPTQGDGSPEQSSGAPGKSGDAPGKSDDTPGNSREAPGKSGTSPGRSDEAPGHSDQAPGNSGTAPGQSGDAPGQSSDAPGQSSDAPGQSGDAPGNGSTAPGGNGQGSDQGNTNPSGQGGTPPGPGNGNSGNDKDKNKGGR